MFQHSESRGSLRARHLEVHGDVQGVASEVRSQHRSVIAVQTHGRVETELEVGRGHRLGVAVSRCARRHRSRGNRVAVVPAGLLLLVVVGVQITWRWGTSHVVGRIGGCCGKTILDLCPVLR